MCERHIAVDTDVRLFAVNLTTADISATPEHADPRYHLQVLAVGEACHVTSPDSHGHFRARHVPMRSCHGLLSASHTR